MKMGKRYVEHDSTLDTPTNKKRKTESSHQPILDSTTEKQLAAGTPGDDVTYSLTAELVDGVVITDLCAKKWRCGKPIGEYKNRKQNDPSIIDVYLIGR